jgi:Biopolymer transport protein ExbD/TolR
MASALANPDRQPMGEINTTPLIDVMLVLLIMFVITIPAATHSLEVPIPSGGGHRLLETNRIALTAGDQVLWNGETVTLGELSALLAAGMVITNMISSTSMTSISGVVLISPMGWRSGLARAKAMASSCRRVQCSNFRNDTV